jgi:glycosyltransferase involved in cell wall biosynthesis
VTGGRRRLLFLAPFAPRRDAPHGGGRAMAGLISRLATRHRVMLLCLRAAQEPPVDEALVECCEEVREFDRWGGTGRSRGLGERLARHGRTLLSPFTGQPKWAFYCAVPALAAAVRETVRDWRPELVQMEYAVMGQYATLTEEGVPRVLDQYEPGAAAARDLWRASRGLVRVAAGLDSLAWERFERGVVRRMSAVVTLTDRDREAMRRLVLAAHTVTIPLGTDLPGRALDPAGDDPPSLLFVGSFHHPPNVEAAARLIRTIFPEVRRQIPAATLVLVGEDLPEALRREAGPGVAVTGRVESVEPWLDSAAVVMAPLELGGGMRVKVLEALAAGKAVVASPRAVEGLPGLLEAPEGGAVALARSDSEAAARAVELLRDRSRRIALAGRARAWAEDHLGWDRIVTAYEELYERLLTGREA